MKHSVHIESHGPMGQDVKITTPDGNEIKRLRSITIRADTEDLITVELEVLMPTFSLTARVTEVNLICPVCEDHIIHNCGRE